MIKFLYDVNKGLHIHEFQLGERTSQWQITLQAIGSAPITGYGAGSYAQVFQSVRGLEDLRQVVYNQAHNQYLHLWLEQGLIGLLLWLSLAWLALKSAHKFILRSKSTLEKSVLIAAFVVILSGLIQALVDFNLQITSIQLYFFLWMALIYVTPDLHSRHSRNKMVRINRNQ